MTGIIHQQQSPMRIFLVQKICRVFHELMVRKLIQIAIEKSPNNFVVKCALKDSCELRDLDIQRHDSYWTEKPYLLACMYVIAVFVPRYQ